MTTWPDGRVVIVGPAQTRVTNIETGRSRTFSTAGVVDIRPNADGSTTLKAIGSTLIYFLEGDLGPGQPGALWLVRGVFEERFFADETTFTLVSHSLVGLKTDVCALLG